MCSITINPPCYSPRRGCDSYITITHSSYRRPCGVCRRYQCRCWYWGCSDYSYCEQWYV